MLLSCWKVVTVGVCCLMRCSQAFVIPPTTSRRADYSLREFLSQAPIEKGLGMSNLDAGGESVMQNEHILLSQVLEDILYQDDDDRDMDDYGEEQDRGGSKNQLSWRARRSQYKSKRYNMLQDVAQLIEKRDPKAIEKAEQVTRRLLEMADPDEFGNDDKPLIQAYNLWLHAISKTSPNSDKGHHAEGVLTEMKERCRPTVVSYTICMMAHTQSPQDAERLLFELLERQQTLDASLVITSSITTDAVLQAWAQQGTPESAERARLILERLEQWQASSTQNAIQANSHTYSIVMNAYSKIGAVEQVEEMLAKRIEADRRLSEDKVDIVMYNVAIKAWAISQDPRAGNRATTLLQQLEAAGLEADIITYNTVLSAWSKSSGHVNAAVQAEKVLQQMITRAKGKGSAPRPNTVSYNTVLHAWSNSPQPTAVQRASSILEYMIRSQDPKPDIYSFTSVLNVVAKSKQPNKASQARRLLDTLLQLSEQRQDLEPSNIAFNTVLNACAFSASFDDDTRREALQIAVSTFSQLRSLNSEICRPDEVTYGNMIKAIGNLLSRNRTKRQQLALTVMRQCMEDGLVGDMVWKELPKCVTTASLASLLPTALQEKPTVELIDLPRNWRHNVRVKAQRKQRKKPTKTNPRRAVRPIIKGPRGITEASWASGKDL
jgi:anion-transporting  ArsA/GET3 family ATPase